MFDIAWSELALIGAVALVVIGPKDLPKVMRTMGQWTRRARLLAGEFQRNIDDMVHQADLDDVRRQVQSVTPAAMKAHVENMIGADAIRDGLKVDAPMTASTMAAAASLAPAAPSEGEAAAAVPAPPANVAPPAEAVASAKSEPQQ
jgi:sec-independent protein translocase protein TatB